MSAREHGEFAGAVIVSLAGVALFFIVVAAYIAAIALCIGLVVRVAAAGFAWATGIFT